MSTPTSGKGTATPRSSRRAPPPPKLRSALLWWVVTLASALFFAFVGLRTGFGLIVVSFMLATYFLALQFVTRAGRARPTLALPLGVLSMVVLNSALLVGPLVIVSRSSYPNWFAAGATVLITYLSFGDRWPFTEREFKVAVAVGLATIAAASVLLRERTSTYADHTVEVATDLTRTFGKDGLLVNASYFPQRCDARVPTEIAIFGSSGFWKKNADDLRGWHTFGLVIDQGSNIGNVVFAPYKSPAEVADELNPVEAPRNAAASTPLVQPTLSDLSIVRSANSTFVTWRIKDWQANRVPIRLTFLADWTTPKSLGACYFNLPRMRVTNVSRTVAVGGLATVQTPAVGRVNPFGSTIDYGTSTPPPRVAFADVAEWLCTARDPQRALQPSALPGQQPSASKYTFSQADTCSAQMTLITDSASTVRNLVLVLLGAGGSLAAALLTQVYLRAPPGRPPPFDQQQTRSRRGRDRNPKRGAD